MKNIRKIIQIASILSSAALLYTGCARENPDLEGYPETALRIDVADIEKPVPVLSLRGVYGADGKIVLDGALTHDYLIRLSKPSPQDMTLKLEPICVNIPAEKVVLSTTEYRLPAGFVEIPVSVAFTDEKFDVSDADKDAKTYELGVRIVGIQGYKTSGKGVEGKVVIDKEAYSANISLADAEGRAVKISRAFWEGELLDTEPMSYRFKAYLDKPASKEIKVAFTMEGLDPAFSNDWSVTPSSVVIPAGSLVSEEVVWTLKNNFLLSSAEQDKYGLTLDATYESADPYVALKATDASITFDVGKENTILGVLSQSTVPAEWNKLSKAQWYVTGSAGVTKLFDDNSNNNQLFSGLSGFTAIVDMKTAQTLAGFTVKTLMNASYNVGIVEILVSDDGVNTTSLGTLTGLSSPYLYHIIKLKKPVSTRYVVFIMRDVDASPRVLSEIDIFGK